IDQYPQLKFGAAPSSHRPIPDAGPSGETRSLLQREALPLGGSQTATAEKFVFQILLAERLAIERAKPLRGRQVFPDRLVSPASLLARNSQIGEVFRPRLRDTERVARRLGAHLRSPHLLLQKG